MRERHLAVLWWYIYGHAQSDQCLLRQKSSQAPLQTVNSCFPPETVRLYAEIMLATRTLLSKKALTIISRQPACFVHQGDYGNWGNTNVAVVSSVLIYPMGLICIYMGTVLSLCASMHSRFSQDVDGGMGLMSMKGCSEYQHIRIFTLFSSYLLTETTSDFSPQHYVPPEPERRSLPDVRSQSAADACDRSHEKAARLRGEPVGTTRDWAHEMGPTLSATFSVTDCVWPFHRNMMMESARFSHGQGKMQMQDLSVLDANSFDAVIFPGGHGIIKNL